jgi:hypothetical protein
LIVKDLHGEAMMPDEVGDDQDEEDEGHSKLVGS